MSLYEYKLASLKDKHLGLKVPNEVNEVPAEIKEVEVKKIKKGRRLNK